GSALGREQDYSQLGREIASSYLLLGGLRVSGIAANALGSGIRIRPIQGVIQQAGMLGGILLGHGLEESFQLWAHQAGATRLVDSLALLLQFNVAGNLTRHAFGEGFHAWEQGLELQTSGLTLRSLPHSNVDSWESPGMTFATALGPIPSVDSPTAASVPSGPVRMTAMKPPSRAQGHGGRSLRPTVAEQIEEALEQMREDPPPSEPRRKILQATEVHFTKPESETGLTAEMLSFYRETLWQLLRPE